MQNLSEVVKEFVSHNGQRMLTSAIVILVGMILVKKLNKIFTIFCHHINVTSSEFNFFNWGIKTLIYFTMFSLVSSQFEFKIWSTIASLSASIVALSVVFKENVSNFMAGVSILMNKLIHIDDIIQIGANRGRVIKIGSLCTYLITEENKTVIIPNSKIVSDVLVRESQWDLINVNFQIDIRKNVNEEEIDKKIYQKIKSEINKIIKIILFKNKYVSNDPPPTIRFESSPAPLCKISLYMQKNKVENLKDNILAELKREFEKHNVEIT